MHCTCTGHRSGASDRANHQVDVFHRLLVPLVNDLLELYAGVVLHLGSQATVVQAVLGLICCDVPATRELISAGSCKCESHMCSQCQESQTGFRNFVKNPEIVAPKTHANAINRGLTWLRADSQATRDKLLTTHGYRYSPLVQLPYFNITRDHAFDKMHSVLEGNVNQTQHMIIKTCGPRLI